MDPSPNHSSSPERKDLISGRRRPALPEDKTGVRLVLTVLVAILLANLFSFIPTLSGIELPEFWGIVLRAGLSIGAAALAVHLFVLRPLQARMDEAESKRSQLTRFHQDLERRLAEHDLDLAATRNQLESELAARDQADAEVRRLAAELEQKVASRTAQLEATVRELQTEMAERKRAADLLRDSEKRYRHLLEIANQGIWTFNAQGRTNFINRRGAELLGYTVPEMLGRTPRELIFPEDLTGELQTFDFQRNAPPEPLQFRLRRKDGGERWVRASVGAIAGESGEYLGGLILFSDWTMQRQAEQRQLAQTALLESAAEAVILCDPQWRVIFWNQGAQQLYGWSAAEVLGKNVLLVLADPSFPVSGEEIMDTIQQRGCWGGELHQLAKGGAKLVVDARVNRGGSEPASGLVLLLCRDITFAQAREARLRREVRAETAGSLIDGLAQELNTQLTPILLSAELLRNQQPSTEAQSLVDNIQTSADHCAELLKQALTFSRGSEGDRGLIQPARLLREMAEIARETFPRSIQVVCEAPPGLWEVKGDLAQLHHVFLKLCVSARDAMPNGGTLRLRAANQPAPPPEPSRQPQTESGPMVIFEVHDTGPAIAGPVQERIFEPFFSNKERGHTPGLGLAAALGVIRSHGGSIEVQSQPDAGATFLVQLPAVPSSTATPIAEAALELPAGRGELILFVEEDAAAREVTRAILIRSGYEVLLAAEGMEALGLLAQHRGRVKLLLTNIRTPSFDGPSLARAARKVDPTIRIIALSALGCTAGQGNKVAALQSLGIGQVVAKPFTAQKLLRALREELDRPVRA